MCVCRERDGADGVYRARPLAALMSAVSASRYPAVVKFACLRFEELGLRHFSIALIPLRVKSTPNCWSSKMKAVYLSLFLLGGASAQCLDSGNDCCASFPSEPAQCSNGYYPSTQPTSFSNCPNYQCLPYSTLGVTTTTAVCTDTNSDCCASQKDGDWATCQTGYHATHQPQGYLGCEY